MIAPMLKNIMMAMGLVLVVAGCASSPAIFSTRLQDIEKRDYYNRRESFKRDETNAVTRFVIEPESPKPE